MNLKITATGPRVEVVHKLGQAIPDAKSGEHVWIVMGVWKANSSAIAEGMTLHLDTENLLNLDGPLCYVCEQAWSADLAAVPCPGDPTR